MAGSVLPMSETADRLDLEALRLTVDGIGFAYGDAPVLEDVSLFVEPGTVLALLGPSGCGKTTLLRIIAGLERPSHGTVQLGDAVLTSRDRFVPPERRRIGMVFQEGALFPHLSVAANVAFGLPRGRERAARVAQALELVGLGDLGDRLPSTLSGGQRQRVALARALAPAPSALLLDEPFANLDPSLRVQLRSEVAALLRRLGITSVFVTHDQEEAFVLGDKVAVMRAGHLLQLATPSELYERPADRWVAGFVGDANLIAGAGGGSCAETALGDVPLTEPARGSVEVLVRPENVALAEGGPWTVEAMEFYGHDTLYVLTTDDGAPLHARAAAAPRHRPGDRVSVRYAGPPTVAYPAER